MSPAPETSTVLYKILTEDEHKALFNPAPQPGTLWPGTPLDCNDGFIHSSTSDQLRATLGRFFKDHTVVHLLSIPRTIPRIEQTLQFDLAPSVGEKFGHLYKGLDLATEVSEQRVVRKVDGEWQIGELPY